MNAPRESDVVWDPLQGRYVKPEEVKPVSFNRNPEALIYAGLLTEPGVHNERPAG